MGTRFGRYELIERISVGGMAEVFRGRASGEAGFEKIVAIKRILPHLSDDQEFISMFIDEAKLSANLNHSNIGQVFEFGRVESSYFIAMEYIHGNDVRRIQEHFASKQQSMPVPMAIRIVLETCNALEYAHSKRDASGRQLEIVHRDVSPQNILISFEGAVKLIDFGIAKALSRSTKTAEGNLKGKFGYMSPEQVEGHEIDGRSDIFALGTVLFELVTGQRLFAGESELATLEKVRNAVVPQPSGINPNVPRPLEEIVMRALARRPDDRYQQAEEMHEALERFAHDFRQVFTSKQLSRWMKSTFPEEARRSPSAAPRVKPTLALGDEPQQQEAEKFRPTLRVDSGAGPVSGPGRGGKGSGDPRVDQLRSTLLGGGSGLDPARRTASTTQPLGSSPVGGGRPAQGRQERRTARLGASPLENLTTGQEQSDGSVKRGGAAGGGGDAVSLDQARSTAVGGREPAETIRQVMLSKGSSGQPGRIPSSAVSDELLQAPTVRPGALDADRLKAMVDEARQKGELRPPAFEPHGTMINPEAIDELDGDTGADAGFAPGQGDKLGPSLKPVTGLQPEGDLGADDMLPADFDDGPTMIDPEGSSLLKDLGIGVEPEQAAPSTDEAELAPADEAAMEETKIEEEVEEAPEPLQEYVVAPPWAQPQAEEQGGGATELDQPAVDPLQARGIYSSAGQAQDLGPEASPAYDEEAATIDAEDDQEATTLYQAPDNLEELLVDTHTSEPPRQNRPSPPMDTLPPPPGAQFPRGGPHTGPMQQPAVTGPIQLQSDPAVAPTEPVLDNVPTSARGAPASTTAGIAQLHGGGKRRPWLLPLILVVLLLVLGGGGGGTYYFLVHKKAKGPGKTKVLVSTSEGKEPETKATDKGEKEGGDEAASGSAAAAEPGVVVVRSDDPLSGTLTLDGKTKASLISAARYTLQDVPPGKHTLKVQDGERVFSHEVEIKGGETVTVTVKMPAAPDAGPATPDAAPATADEQKGGDKGGEKAADKGGTKGTKPAGSKGTKQSGAKGTRQAGSKGTKPAGSKGTKQAGARGQTRPVRRGGTTRRRGKPGYLIVASRPWSKIYVNGKATGRNTPVTPSNPLSLPPGRHRITLEAGGKKFTFPVRIQSGETSKLVKVLKVE